MPPLLEQPTVLKVFAILAAAGVIAAAALFKRSKRDQLAKKKILDFLIRSASKAQWEYRKTSIIASETGLSESQVEKLCPKIPEIRRDKEQRKYWRLATEDDLREQGGRR